MAAPLEFFFDFSSPYGYFASTAIEALARKHGRVTVWHPILLGLLFPATGGQPIPSIPVKGVYGVHDMARSARYHNIAFQLPTRFPISTQAAARAYYFAVERYPEQAKRLADAFFHAYMVESRDISSPETTADVASAVGLDRSEVLTAIADLVFKERVRSESAGALARGVFGSPFVIVDGEPFWGFDRFDQIDRWLATGGW